MVLASWGQGAGNLLGYSCLGTVPEGPVGIAFITLNWTELLFSRLLFFLALWQFDANNVFQETAKGQRLMKAVPTPLSDFRA